MIFLCSPYSFAIITLDYFSIAIPATRTMANILDDYQEDRTGSRPAIPDIPHRGWDGSGVHDKFWFSPIVNSRAMIAIDHTDRLLVVVPICIHCYCYSVLLLDYPICPSFTSSHVTLSGIVSFLFSFHHIIPGECN